MRKSYGNRRASIRFEEPLSEEHCMKRYSAVTAILITTGFSFALWSQQQPAQEKVMSAAPMSGQEMFQVYCAACHGADAKGNGPAAPALKATLPDLTLLTRKGGGKFPLMKVSQVIQGDVVVISHGTREMPIYGDMFRDIRRDELFVKQRVGLLTAYIESIQHK
jgi:mono/diheme cytochrome c family protein